jgi:hypothetical protein
VTRIDKLIAEVQEGKKRLRHEETKVLMGYLGFTMIETKRGSGVKYTKDGSEIIFIYHVPHGGKKTVPDYVMKGLRASWRRSCRMYNKLSYKGFMTTPQYSIEDKVIYGKIDDITGYVFYEAEKAADVEQAFRDAVDEWIEACEEIGIDSRPSYRIKQIA